MKLAEKIKSTIIKAKTFLAPKISNLLGINKNRKAISFYILIDIAWRNLVSKKLRTFLTLFGIIIGIGAIFFLFSFGLGLRDLVAKQVVGDRSIKSIDISTPNSKILSLNDALLNKLNNLPHVSKVGGAFSYPGSVSYKNSESDSVVYAIDKNYQDLSTLNLTAGRLLNKTDSRVAVVNTSLLSSIGITKKAEALGKTISVKIPLKDLPNGQTEVKKEFTIQGVIDSGSGGELFIPAGILQAAGAKHYSQIKLVADDTENVASLRKQIESLGYQTDSPIDTLSQINQIFKFFTVILVGFGSIGMVVSVLGMFNTLTISLLERTKEIGLMMALGSRNRDIRRLFILEAILLSIAGAVIGIFGAVLLGKLINLFMNISAHGRGVNQHFELFSTPIWLMLATIGFMVLVGITVSFFPARRGSRISPIDALRHE